MATKYLTGVTLCAMSVVASTAAASNVPTLEEIIVTASKRDTNLQETAVSVNFLGADFLKDTKAVAFSDVAGSIANVKAPQALNNGGINIRGVTALGRAGSVGLEQPVGLYFDGVYVGTNFLDNLLYDIESVQVLKGPQGTLWGRNTAGGAVTYTSKKPTDEFEAAIELTGGNYDLFTGRAVVSGPLVENVLNGRLAIAHNERDGYFDRTSGGSVGNADTDAARLQLHFTPEDSKFDLLFSASFNNNDLLVPTQSVYGADFSGFAPDIPLYSGFSGEPGSWNTDTSDRYNRDSSIDHYKVSAIYNYVLNEAVTLTGITAYLDYEDTIYTDEDGTVDDIAGSIYSKEIQQFSQEIRLNTDFGGKSLFGIGSSSLTLGVYYFDRDLDDTNEFRLGNAQIYIDDFGMPVTIAGLAALDELGLPPDFALLFADGYSEFSTAQLTTESTALFGELEWQLSDQWAVTLGARWDDETKEFNAGSVKVATDADGETLLGFGVPIPFMAGVPLTTSTPTTDFEDYEEDNLTLMGALSYQWNENAMVYFRYAEGFKAGGHNSDSIVNTDVPATFDAEEAKSYELGLRSEWLQNRLLLNVTAYYIDYKGQQIEQFYGFQEGLVNAGETISKGLEVESRYLLSSNWDVSLNLGLQDAYYDSYFVSDDPDSLGYPQDYTDREVPQSPEVNLSLASSYSVAINDSATLRLFGEYQYSSEYHLSQIWFADQPETERGVQDSYGIFNARVALELSNGVSVSLWGRNLTEEEVMADYAQIEAPFLGRASIELLEPPRTFGVDISVEF